jgi:hypothetical protein
MSSGGVSRSSIAAPIWIFIFQQYFHPQKVVLGTHVVYDVIGKNITSNFTDLSQTIPQVQYRNLCSTTYINNHVSFGCIISIPIPIAAAIGS